MNADSTYFEWRECVRCECKFIEDCSHVVVELGGKNSIPNYCWRKDLIKEGPKPHNTDDKS